VGACDQRRTLPLCKGHEVFSGNRGYQETSLAKIKGRKIDGRLKAIEPSNRGRLEYAGDASQVASLYDGQWRREKLTSVSLKAEDLPARVR